MNLVLGTDTLNPPLTCLEGYPIPKEDVMLLRPEGKREEDVSAGYFLSDLGMICWFYPSLGGLEYVVHHSLSAIAVAYSMYTGEGQLYTFMVLISEVTTPEINMRWFLDTAGLKRSYAYLINGVVIFFAWLVARILLFIYMFYHVSLHYDQVIHMHIFGILLVFGVPAALGVMNLMWFGKIIKGLKKNLSKRV
ncbi:hypothetical protein H5410_007183 [Solanum commersonii]|uniref:TLC domain-containing protein n=1 Tax=Solanum commersonii TaxID=4109 RepID=A0A9J6ABD8_SOLCO|nr:hypothetical protein H5410_007183 [Solanum commersonii]